MNIHFTKSNRFSPSMALVLMLAWSLPCKVMATITEIERFEHLDTRHGLSQSQVVSMYCDRTGFLWFGTFNGLNRYDGYQFRIYKARPGRDHVLSHNRINAIWEDEQGLLWVKTYDGYFHYLDRLKDQFHSFPRFMDSEEEQNSLITCFFQYSPDEIWLGTNHTGIYHLTFDSLSRTYRYRHFISRGVSSITNNEIRYICADHAGGIWIGTPTGLNYLTHDQIFSDEPHFQHFFVNHRFTAHALIGDRIWHGTETGRIIIMDPLNKKIVRENPLASYPGTGQINLIRQGKYGNIVVGTREAGLFISEDRQGGFRHHELNGKDVRSVYEDYLGNLWINTENFGVNRIDPLTGTNQHYVLTPEDIQPIVDDERQFFYEDRQQQLWIGLHGAGLAQYDRDSDRFLFYRNDPGDPKTISSNFVHCIAEDHSGLLWIGTGQFNGGINKAVPVNPSFRQIIPARHIRDISENVVRCVFEDSKGSIWVATKSGEIYIYSPAFELRTRIIDIPLVNKKIPGQNIYAIMEDAQGYLWLGSKGGGIYVSTQRVGDTQEGYDRMRFHVYRNQDDDPHSLSSDMVYTIRQDRHQRIWIGTYGGGLNLVMERTSGKLTCRRINTRNSNLASDDIRQVYEDSRGNLWIASTFGLHLLKDVALADSMLFQVFNYDPSDEGGISYNDVIHMLEDSRGDLWVGTIGGGVNKLLSLDPYGGVFEHYDEPEGLANGAVFGILEDKEGFLWFSTEKGISRLDPASGKMESYNENDGLASSHFNENACIRTRQDELVFGTMNGVLVINPGKITKQKYQPRVVLTNFQLSNKDVDIHDPESPVKTTIETTRKVILKHDQSSFSIEYAALSYIDPGKNQYAFMLENFEGNWNFVGKQRKATYTNLSPGDYIFRVMASDLEGNWGGASTQLEVRILPPWWKTSIAFLIYGFLFLVLVEISRRIITRYSRLRNDLRVERRINEIKLQFFTNISHEIRTPLTLVLGPLEDIRKNTQVPEAVRSSIEIMYRNGRRMLRLINQLLDFRKIQNDKMKLKVREIDYPDFVNTVCSNFHHLAKQKDISYRCRIEQNGQKAWIDKDMIDSVLFNILSNAFKFTPNGKSIEVYMNINQEDNYIDLTVRDEGPGIPAQKKDLLFTRYTNLNTSESYFSGTGIGLALSNEIAKMHHGQIMVRSEPGQGSEFTLRIPLGNSHFRKDDLAGKDYTRSPHRPRSYEVGLDAGPVAQPATRYDKIHEHTVLVVEDNREVLDYIVQNIREEFNVLTAMDGVEGLNVIRAVHPDLVITDIMMPEMDGIQMTLTIKSEFPISHIPIVMLTARSNIDDQIEGIEAGAEAYIMKPFHTKYLKAILHNLLTQRDKVIEKFRDKKEYGPGEIKITPRDEVFIRKVIDIIGKHYADPSLNVEKLAGMANVSKTLFYHKIKGLTGLTPVEFLRQMRLKVAARMIVESGYNISEIAYMCGFNDEKYFRRCFKAFYGKTPSEYKLADRK